MMDPQSKTRLDEILAKEIAALTEEDRGFMRARRSYLTEEQKAVYAKVLTDQPEAQEDEAPKSPSRKAK